MSFELKLFKCSGCRRITSEKWSLKAHQKICEQCKNANVSEIFGSFHFTGGTERSRPRVYGVSSLFRSRVPAWTDEGFEERLAYFMDSRDLVRSFIECGVYNVYRLPVMAFESLWGRRAPVKYQSIVSICGNSVVLEEFDSYGEPVVRQPAPREWLDGMLQFLPKVFDRILSVCRAEEKRHVCVLRDTLLLQTERGIRFSCMQKIHRYMDETSRFARLAKKLRHKQRMNTTEVSAYKCSQCDFTTTMKRLMNRHTRKCNGSRCLPAHCHLNFLGVWNSPTFFSDKEHAFDDKGLDSRMDYLFDTTGLIDRLLSSDDITCTLASFYKCLWGDEAPSMFQSIVSIWNAYVYLHDDNDARMEDKHVFQERMIKVVFDFVRGAIQFFVPRLRPDLVERILYFQDHLLEFGECIVAREDAGVGISEEFSSNVHRIRTLFNDAMESVVIL